MHLAAASLHSINPNDCYMSDKRGELFAIINRMDCRELSQTSNSTPAANFPIVARPPLAKADARLHAARGS